MYPLFLPWMTDTQVANDKRRDSRVGGCLVGLCCNNMCQGGSLIAASANVKKARLS